ncbi:glycosyltransferase family 4 protein [Motilibacter deserti]|uniref:Glycosyltransferase family 4 protein n=1 Tax=Motilibacter deserti TaxID=2714956 RepID=A0ABX0H064_9ACTN|nr:glycosyltransferase family 1 protein [Motilibacter deserti]NHC16223.1 glycosyltransferase family 4 protein [Motilibacter deserti]
MATPGPVFGIDARAAAEVPAGRGRYVRELLRALSSLPHEGERYVLYCRQPADLGLDSRFTWRQLPLPDPAWHLQAAVLASRQCDAFLSTNSYLTAWFTWRPTAVTVHDLVPFRPDAPALKSAQRIEKATIGIALRRARRFLCVSQATRRDLVSRWPATASRARVIPLAADSRFSTASAAVREHPYVLAVGTLEPRKNLPRLLDAWAALSDAERGAHELLLVGPTGWEAEEIVNRAAGAPAVQLLGQVSDDELAALYAGSTLFAYPSLFEGFGLPVLEAMAAGAPVVTSSVSSLPEVAGDAAVLVDPLDTSALRDALASLLTDPARRSALSAAGRARAARFSWERTARETRDVLRSLTA